MKLKKSRIWPLLIMPWARGLVVLVISALAGGTSLLAQPVPTAATTARCFRMGFTGFPHDITLEALFRAALETGVK